MVIQVTPDIAHKLEIFNLDLKRKAPTTRGYYGRIARKFFIDGGDFSRQGMILWLEQNYTDNGIRTVYYVLKRLCRALGVPFPLDTDLLPPIPDEEEIYTPTTPRPIVIDLINHWKQFPGNYITSLVFLSTIYGLRSIEMTSVDLHLPLSFIMIVAKRKGRSGKPVIREHLIPDGMGKFLEGYEQYSERSVTYTFTKVCRAIGYKRQIKENWHGIRRALDTACVDAKIDNILIKRFMRWTKKRDDMVSVYFHKDFAEINQEMFKVHPFLSVWRI